MDFILQGASLFHKGGIVMYLLLICSLVVVYVWKERWMYYRGEDSGRAFASHFYALMRMHQYTEAEECVRRGSGRLVGILTDANDKQANGQYIVIYSNPVGHSAFKIAQPFILSQRYRDNGATVGIVRHYQWHDHILQCFQYRIRPGYCYYGRRGRNAYCDGIRALCGYFIVWSIAYFTQRLDHIINDMELCFSVLEFRCDSKKEMWTLAYNQGPIFVNSSFFYDIVF